MSALAGFRVVELCGGLCGPFAGLRLADAGAEIVKVEGPGGDPARHYGPPYVGDQAAVFAALNRGKQSVALDVSRRADADAFRRLVATADILIEDLGPGRAEAFGIGYETLAASNPGLVYGAISAFGELGPWRDRPGAELVIQAASEYWASLGCLGEEPLRVGADIAAANTAIMAVQAVTGALFKRLRGGQGQRVSVSQLGTLLHTRGVVWSAMTGADDFWGFHVDTDTRPLENGYGTGDGRVYFALRRANSEDFDTLMIQLGLVDYLEDPRFGGFGRDAAPMGRRTAEAKEVWEEGFANFSSAEVVEMVLGAGGDCVPLTDYPTITEHEQVRAIGVLSEVAAPGGGTMRTVGPVWRFSDTPAAAAATASPGYGEHTDAVLGSVGLSIAELQSLARPKADSGEAQS